MVVDDWNCTNIWFWSVFIGIVLIVILFVAVPQYKEANKVDEWCKGNGYGNYYNSKICIQRTQVCNLAEVCFEKAKYCIIPSSDVMQNETDCGRGWMDGLV